MKSIIFLVSGGGGTLKAVCHAIDRLGWNATIDLVIGDRECGALEFARQSGIRPLQVRYASDDDHELFSLLSDADPALIVTTITKIISTRILELHPGRFVNVHYSLLPDYAGMIGMRPVEAAANSDAQEIGATVHTVTEYLDQGPILGQCRFGVDWSSDSLDDVSHVVFRGACLVLLQTLAAHVGASSDGVADTVDILGRNVSFSPPLTFDVSVLDDAYWLAVSTT